MSYHGFEKKHKVSIRQYTGSKGYWVGTQIIFSGKDAAHCYNLIKTQKFDLETLMMDQHTLSLSRIDLCFSRTNGPNNTIKSFDGFLVNSRTQIQNHTTTRHIRLQDFPNGKVLKINRRNNSLHYRVYQKDQSVRFELEFKHRQDEINTFLLLLLLKIIYNNG
jgi:DNA relaxase NicK